MSINFTELKNSEISPKVRNWMELNGTNHTNLLAAWREHPEFASDIELITESLAWALNRKSQTVIERLWSKFNKVRREQEDEELKRFLKPTPDCLL